MRMLVCTRERVCLRVCVCVRVRACVRACVHACVHACIRGILGNGACGIEPEILGRHVSVGSVA